MGQIDAHFVEPVNRRELFEGSMQGMVRKLDPYSGYIPPEDYRELKETLDQEFGGIGIVVEVDIDRGRPVVLSPQPAAPAYEAGIRAGDVIMKVDGQDTSQLSQDAIVDLIRGPPGTEVTLTILPYGSEETVEFRVRRAVIPIESVLGYSRQPDGSWRYVLPDHPRIGYIWLDSFGENTAQDMARVLESLDSTVDALIVDVRANAGGLLDSAVETCDLFLDSGLIVSIRGRGGRVDRVFRAKQRNDRFPRQRPMAILVDRYSASASEIFAACLQDHGRAVVIGERTWGKGTVQEVIELEGGRSALRLTTATYWRPSGRNIHRLPKSTDEDDWGVAPNEGFEVVFNKDDYLHMLEGRRERLAPALPDAQQGAATPSDADSFQDTQLANAIEYIQAELERDAPGESRMGGVPPSPIARKERGMLGRQRWVDGILV
jgi:carboxyl-terminal processing protease